jgi:catechol 2,3-dioxygenase-like lactoylglutathione lyase family enzyme
MIKTHGLTHLNLEVSDLDISLRFYRDMFGVEEYFRDKNSVQVKGPGENDVIAFVKSEKAGMEGGISHFGFRLLKASDIDHALETAKSIGAKIVKTGEFSPGFPYLYILDPDGYEIEIWYE